MANIWEINESLMNAIEYGIDPETGELLEGEELQSKVDELEMLVSDKMENIGAWIINLESDINEFKEAKKKLEQRRRTVENKKSWLENYLYRFIKAQYTNEDGITDEAKMKKFSLKTPRVVLKFGTSKKVEVTDLSKVPDEFIKEHTKSEDDVMKAELTKYLKENTNKDGNLDPSIDFAKLKESVNLQIK